ncbi:hypothetical protein [Leucothrix mucor]|jgi:hypothetical protein|uniref:hypothetical protein n=1 Tax=Leucothrix mucor TaxID=45248 RepID=UPI0003B5A012|nr:hypothetical protein [Leucothrix mucor]
MSKLALILVLVLCSALVVLPLWASWQGMGEAKVTKQRDSSGRILYVGSRSWSGGGPSAGK